MNNALMFSKASDEWATPQEFYECLNTEFRFHWDAAASQANAKCGPYNFYGPDHTSAIYRDALTLQQWMHGPDRCRFWMNPPYSRCREFIAKAAAEVNYAKAFGGIVVALVPARTDTRWFHEHIWDDVRHAPRQNVEVRFMRGRLKFGDGKNSAPFPSMVVIFRGQ